MKDDKLFPLEKIKIACTVDQFQSNKDGIKINLLF